MLMAYVAMRISQIVSGFLKEKTPLSLSVISYAEVGYITF